jgi:hypothetical protein
MVEEAREQKKVDRRSVDRIEQQNKMRRERDKDREQVKGIFRFYEVPGGNLSFVLKLHKEDEVEKYSMNDGEIYTVPLGVAKHLNKNGWYPVHSFKQNESGAPSSIIGKKVQRFGFQSLEFVDLEEFNPGNDIITVTST